MINEPGDSSKQSRDGETVGDFPEFLVNITSERKYLFNLPRVRERESKENGTPNLLRNEVKRASMKPISKSNCYRF